MSSAVPSQGKTATTQTGATEPVLTLFGSPISSQVEDDVTRPRWSMDESPILPRPDGDRTLEEVIEKLAGSVRPAGADEPIDEWLDRERSFQRLVAWAKQQGVFYEGLKPARQGGREHDVTYDDATGTWLKFTKPSSAGYLAVFDVETRPFELENGQPEPYLLLEPRQCRGWSTTDTRY